MAGLYVGANASLQVGQENFSNRREVPDYEQRGLNFSLDECLLKFVPTLPSLMRRPENEACANSVARILSFALDDLAPSV